MPNHQHIYSTLRSALIDRDRDELLVQENGILVTIGESQFAVKNSVPSGAVLMAYSILFFPGFMDTAARNREWFIEAAHWLGGENNPRYPLFANETIASIALAVALRTKLLVVGHNGFHALVRPDFTTPIVRRTYEIVQANNLGINDAKELFLLLMQDEEYRLDVPFADDYIDNKFINEFDVSIDMTVEEQQSYFRGVKDLHE